MSPQLRDITRATGKDFLDFLVGKPGRRALYSIIHRGISQSIIGIGDPELKVSTTWTIF
jgi:hypothetical protein